MGFIEQRVLEFGRTNIGRLLYLEDYCENYIQAGEHLLLFDTTVPGWVMELHGKKGCYFTLYSSGELSIEDKVGVFFFFEHGEDKLIEKEIMGWLK